MNDIKMRVLVGLYEGDSAPMIAGGVDDGTYEVIPEEDWAVMVRQWKEMFDPGGQVGYEWREATVSLPVDELAALFQHGEISGSVTGG